MKRHTGLISVFVLILSGILCITMVSVGADNILDTGATGTDLVMADLALRNTTSYTGEPSDWRIYFHPGVRFGTDDRVIGFYDVLVPLYLSDDSILFINPRFSHDSLDGHEWNLGGGYRHILWKDQLMLGVNAYYDIKKHGMSGKYFDQWGMGFEAMGEFDNVLAEGGGLGLTGRFNFYIPLSGSKSAGGAGVGAGGGGYIFHSLGIYIGTGGGGSVYEPLCGLDYELGMRIPYLSNYVETWAYAGGYHYQGRESGSLDGFCGRIEVIPADFLVLDFEYRNDNRYGDEFYGEVKVEVPFSIGNLVTGENPFDGLGSRFGGSRDLHERMVEPVRRDIDIRIETVESTGDGGGAGGLIEEVVFVSEGGEADPLADGTFEHPYASIADAMTDARIGVTAFTIHVINDNGGDGVAGGGNVTLSNIFLWGSGVPHPIYPGISNMTSGYPTIDSSVSIAMPSVEVCGLNFNTAGSGVNLMNGTGVVIRDNIITGIDIGVYSFLMGDLGSPTDPLVIMNNEITVSGSGDVYGMQLNAFFGSIYARFNNNSIDVTSTGGTAMGAFFYAWGGLVGSAVMPTEFRNNTGTITGASNRVMLYLVTTSPGSGSNFVWSGNSFAPAGGDGTWDGNYDAGVTPIPPTGDLNRPVFTNFTVGDTINP